MANLFYATLNGYVETFARADMLSIRQIDANNLAMSLLGGGASGTEDTFNFTYSSDCTACYNAMKVNMTVVTGVLGDVYINPLNVSNLLVDSYTSVNVYSPYGVTFIEFADTTQQMAAWTTLYNATALLTIDLGTAATHAVGDFATAAQGAKADTALQSQVQADWNSVSGASMILDKPTLGTAAATNSSDYATAAQGVLAATALQTAPVTTVAGRTGAITLSNTDISGLGTAATTASTAYATAAQGAKADTALQTAPVTSVAGRTGAITLSNTDISGLGTAATTSASAYATAAQGAKADTAYQSSTSIPYSQLTGTPTIPAAQVQSDWNASSGLGVILNKPTITINNAPSSPPIVTTNAAANGAVLSTTKDVEVFYSLDLSTTANISGNASVISLLQINPSSSATTGWVTINKASNSQALTLAITLQSVQGTSGSLVGRIPAGYSHRILNTIVGTASATFAFGQTITQG